MPELPDHKNPEFALQTVDTDILTAVACGEVDLNELASRELAKRGLNIKGQWVGFDQAERMHEFRMGTDRRHES